VSVQAASIWGIAALATAGVILRPFHLPEAVWAVAGAAILVVAGLLPPADALRGIARGTDVYLFLTGMMLLAELAREQGLFDWLAAHAAAHARGSATRLFTLVYLVGTVVTVFLSNDATAVVLTPAVAAVARAARAEQPLPFLLVCAFIANAASFVLPISNPANLVIYGSHMPPLLHWLPRYVLPALAAILATYAVLWLTQRRALRQSVAATVETPSLSTGGMVAAGGIVLTAGVLMLASALDWPLGLPTCLAGLASTVAVLLCTRSAPWAVLRGVSWAVLPLVAGLFVLVQALERTGLLRMLALLLRQAERYGPAQAAGVVGVAIALASNLVNNLPAGLVAGGVVQAAQAPPQITGAVLIGVDLGPNLSVTGSLATILWLTALRREGQHVGAWSFLRLGVLVMPPALLLALAALAF
jgi:arsenical pump membrane protein